MLNRIHDNESWLTSFAPGVMSQSLITSANQPHHNKKIRIGDVIPTLILYERLANKYYDVYGYNSDGGIFQQYPKKKYRPMAMATVVDILNADGDLEKEILINADD